MNNKFNFYDIVRISSQRKTLKQIDGADGVILGMSLDEKSGIWGYAVSVYEDQGFVWDILETEILYTGKKANPGDYKPVDTVKVRVDPKTGKGEIIEDDEE